MLLQHTIVLWTLYRTTYVTRHPCVKNSSITFTVYVPWLMVTNAFGLDRGCQKNSQLCYLYHLHASENISLAEYIFSNKRYINVKHR